MAIIQKEIVPKKIAQGVRKKSLKAQILRIKEEKMPEAMKSRPLVSPKITGIVKTPSLLSPSISFRSFMGRERVYPIKRRKMIFCGICSRDPVGDITI